MAMDREGRGRAGQADQKDGHREGEVLAGLLLTGVPDRRPLGVQATRWSPRSSGFQ